MWRRITTPGRILDQVAVFRATASGSYFSSSSSSQLSPPPRRPPPHRLLRPTRFHPTATAADDSFGAPSLRPHTITLFPGNFQDKEWDNDDVDDENHRIAKSIKSEMDHEDKLSAELQQAQRALDEQKQRWLQNARKPERISIIDDRGRAYGRGGRKTAQARVWIQPGFGEVTVNHKTLVGYFDRQSDRELVLEPLVATETCGTLDVTVQVRGGGLTGQAGAIRHGLANALNAYNPHLYRPPLKILGMLTRDARKVERKKIGKLKARKSPQWVRR